MGLAPMAHILFNYFMDFSPQNPNWINRDRFVLSNGHACMLHYSLLYLSGYGLTLDDIKSFRQVDSRTPGHPEANHGTKGIEVTTGPLGQGVSNAVGLAIAQKHTAAKFNKPNHNIINNYTFCFMGDGCAMEGVSSEACSLAGHLRLGNLIVIYDDNKISIDGDTAVSFTEDVGKRYEAYGWHVIHVDDGNSDLKGMARAIEQAKYVKDQPTLIVLPTTIGFGSKLQGTGAVHGSALKADDIEQIKQRFGFNPKESFVVPQEVSDFYHKTAQRGNEAEKAWNEKFDAYAKAFPKESAELKRILSGKLPEGWEKCLPTFKPEDKAVATRKTSEMVLTKLVDALPELVGGSADLTTSNLTRWGSATDFQPETNGLGTYAGRYIRFGVREHGMGAIMNGMGAYGTVIPFGGTFLNFVSYAAGAVRLSALSKTRVIWVATHDSIGLGEDGPTHQPIETLAHFRALPNMMVWRPADGNETSAAYYTAMTAKNTPSILALSRQNLPQLENSTLEHAIKGGYTLVDSKNAEVTLVSTGSEVSICVDAVQMLKEKHGVVARVVSLPCWEVFDQQDKEYKQTVFPDGIPIMSVEVMSTLGWEKYSHEQFGLTRFGESGPYLDVYKKFEFTPEGVSKRALQTIDFWKEVKPIRAPFNRAFTQIL